MVQGGRRCREAGRQPVRDRDRQGFDGGAVDHYRHADRDQGESGRRCARRRRGRDHCGRGRRGRKRYRGEKRARSFGSAAGHCLSPSHSRAIGNPGPRTGSPLARGRAGTSEFCLRKARSVRPRHPVGRRSRRWRGGLPARTASTCHESQGLARAGASSRPTWKRPLAAAQDVACPRWRPAHPPNR